MSDHKENNIPEEEAINTPEQEIQDEMTEKTATEAAEIAEPSKKKKKKGLFSGNKKEENEESSRITELENEVAEWKDKYLRLFSEFDNFRKRTAKERMDLLKTASADVLVKMLAVVDDFERAMKSLKKDDEVQNAYFQGMELIYAKLIGILKNQGLTPMETLGKDFDTDFHEALTNIPAPSDELKGKVVDEIEKGYMLGDKVVRYAKVVIGN
ncbi:MAG: nucleotide exchange factor GrpE [Bacteroidales bacterium]|nr:nucleotide exchange factor GrpE [Bacteroidales bacterium]